MSVRGGQRSLSVLLQQVIVRISNRMTESSASFRSAAAGERCGQDQADTGIILAGVPVDKMDREEKVDFGLELANLGYPGYGHHRKGECRFSPAEFLVRALSEKKLAAGTAQGLPWVAFTYCDDLDWKLVYEQAQRLKIQNRLGFTLSLARNYAVFRNRTEITAHLSSALEFMVPLDKEDTYCNVNMTEAERTWLRKNRPPEAVAWNLLSNLRIEHCLDNYRG